MLERVAELLEVQEANPHRVRAYRRAAQTIRQTPRPLAAILEEGGTEALEELPTIGRGIAAQIAELLHRRHSSLLERLEGEVSPVELLASVPGLGPELARRAHEELSIDTLEELEQAAHDGSLERVRGFGPRRTRAMREELASLLGRSARHRARRLRWLEEQRRPQPSPAPPFPRPSVALLLDLDREYRSKAEAGLLRRIAPRRFNPNNEAWLPVLHVERDDWDCTVLFSNTARAHELGRTRDWVIVYYHRDGDEGQCTVVTETHGPLAGRRVVRGREKECEMLARPPPAPGPSA